MRKLFWLLVLLVALPVAAQDAEVNIAWPPPVYVVAGVVEVRGTVNPPDLQGYFLEAAPYDAAEPVWLPVTLLSSTPVVDGVLASWPTVVLPDGVYSLRLHVQLRSGETRFATAGPLRVANTLQAPAGESVVVPVAPLATPEPAPAEPTLVGRPNPVNQMPVPVGGHVTYFSDPTIALMQGAGMTWVKWQIPFLLNDTNLINVARDRINWSHAAGFNVLLSITGEVSELRDLNEDYYPRYAEFLGQIAALGPDAIEVWNEMNIDREWPSGRISARAYVEMLRQAHAAIKAADPQVLVITGAPAPTGFFGGCSGAGCDDGDYYFNMANAGAAQYADCIGVHYNEGILPPQQTGGDPRDAYPTRYFKLMANRAAVPFRGSGLPLCFTELGYLSPEGYGPLPGNFAWATSTSVEEQATWLRDVVTLAAEYETAPIAMIIIFNVDFDRYDDEDPQAGYAIIRPDGLCPACDALASLLPSG
ncbi:MAG: hypothetical protein JNJ61_07010 [Anaerolineae bacterium]|nr:hypothetical protein [Anaerolineae bacterium]